jgi:hypothetical protein
MKKIPLQEAYQILEEASAIVVEDQVLFPVLSPPKGENHHTFLLLEWEDSEKLWYELEFDEGENQTVAVSGSSLFLFPNDTPEEEVQITVLQEKNLE